MPYLETVNYFWYGGSIYQHANLQLPNIPPYDPPYGASGFFPTPFYLAHNMGVQSYFEFIVVIIVV